MSSMHSGTVIGNHRRGHLKSGPAAKADLAKYETRMQQVKKGPRAYLAEGTADRKRHRPRMGRVRPR